MNYLTYFRSLRDAVAWRKRGEEYELNECIVALEEWHKKYPNAGPYERKAAPAIGVGVNTADGIVIFEDHDSSLKWKDMMVNANECVQDLSDALSILSEGPTPDGVKEFLDGKEMTPEILSIMVEISRHTHTSHLYSGGYVRSADSWWQMKYFALLKRLGEHAATVEPPVASALAVQEQTKPKEEQQEQQAKLESPDIITAATAREIALAALRAKVCSYDAQITEKIKASARDGKFSMSLEFVNELGKDFWVTFGEIYSERGFTYVVNWRQLIW